MKIPIVRRVAAGLTLAMAFTVGGAVAASASTTGSSLPALKASESVVAPLGVWHVLRDDFKSYATCESYRVNYAVNYPYHVDSYCTESAASNGRHWLYIYYGI